jgi:hypothetical protein
MSYFIENKEDYLKIIESWKNYLKNGGKPTSSHMMLYNILRSKPFDRGFSPVTKQIKIDNGANPWQCLKDASWKIGYKSYECELLEPFGELVASKEIKIAWEQIKTDARLK